MSSLAAVARRCGRGRVGALPTMLAGVALTAGCATGPQVTGFDQVTIGPGYTGTCESSPCQIYYKMPAGTGSYTMLGNEVDLGQYPAGQTSMIGAFWHSVGIKVKGMDVPEAYVYIPQER